jgi:uncharacterized membrane protein YciS (DUF1049 family)
MGEKYIISKEFYSMKKIIFLTLLLALLLVGCGAKNDELFPATYDITGTWEYRMSELDQQATVYDSGTITLTGTVDEGTYIRVDANGNETTGTYIVSNIAFSFYGDDELIVQGSFPEPGALFGSWEWQDESTGGLWTAKQQ